MLDFQAVRTLNTKTNPENDLNRWMQGFLFERKTSQVSKNTLKFYRVEFGRFFAFCESSGVDSMDALSPEFLRRYLMHLEETGRNPGGINAGYRALKSLLIWYENEEEPENWHNPIRKVKMPKLAIEPLEPVDLDDVQRLIATCEGSKPILNQRDKAMLLFLLDTGARAFEICAMDLEDADLLLGEVLIRKGKGNKPRTVCIGKKTRKAVRSYLKCRKDKTPALWIADNGERLTYWGLNQMLRRRASQAGIPKPGLHDFRRAFALNCLRGGMDVYSLQKLMGHADLQVLRRYLAQSDDDIRNAHAKASPVDRAGF